MDETRSQTTEEEEPPSIRPGGRSARIGLLLAAAACIAAAPGHIRSFGDAEADPSLRSCRAEVVEDLPRAADLPDAFPHLWVDAPGRVFVDRWMARLRRTSPVVLDAYLSRAEPWREEVLPVLELHGLPEGLLYLPLVESGMDPEAVSPANAVGLWQFTDATARRYGLTVSDAVDERRDGRLATKAAGRYLRDLYREFGSWELALAAYNAGPGRIRRALRRTDARTFWELMEVGALPAETRSYVPRFLALVELSRARRGGDVGGSRGD